MSAKKTKSDGLEIEDPVTPEEPGQDTATPESADNTPDTDGAADRAEETAKDGSAGDDKVGADSDDPAYNDAGVDIDEPVHPDADEPIMPEDDAARIDEPVEDRLEPQPERVIERVVERKGGFAPALFGGILAGLIGFAAGASDLLSSFLPASMQRNTAPAVSVEDVTALRDQIAALEAQIQAAQEAAPPPDLSGIEEKIEAGLAAQAEATATAEAELSERIDGLQTQLTELAQAPVEAAVSEEAIAAYERELAAVQDALARQRSEVEAMIAEAAQLEAAAAESAREAQAQAAAARLLAALDTGSGFADEVVDLKAAGVEVPEPVENATDGVVALSALQAEFPELARDALAAARDDEKGSSGLTGFLQRQLGARSVTPRDGTDPDAILSRAEAALTAGDLEQALGELDALPDAAKAPLASWIDAANKRLAVKRAADGLADSMQAN